MSPLEAIAFHVAAIRELFEEAGVLLARDAAGRVVSLQAIDALAASRAALAGGSASLAAIARRERLRLALDLLTPFAHWVTPEGEPRRFDTRFFLAMMPAAQAAAHDRQETTAGEWVAPNDAIARAEARRMVLPPATWTTLRALATFTTVDEAWAWASSCPIPRIEPTLVERDGVKIVMLPGDPECSPLAGFHAADTRFRLEGGHWRVVDPARR